MRAGFSNKWLNRHWLDVRSIPGRSGFHVKDWARKVILELAQQVGADLIVMGTIARTGIPGFFTGNTAESILNQIVCSVLAIKPAGLITPIKLMEIRK